MSSTTYNINSRVILNFIQIKIKSTTNRGTFSKENPDIYYQGQITDKGALSIDSKEDILDAQVKEKARRTVSATNPSVGELVSEI